MWDKYLRRLILVSIYNFLYLKSTSLDTIVVDTDYISSTHWIDLAKYAIDCSSSEYLIIQDRFADIWSDLIAKELRLQALIEPHLTSKDKTYILLQSLFYTFLLEQKDWQAEESGDYKSLINIYLKLLQEFGANENRQFAHAILAKLYFE